jgi:5-dehydro-2-deoxygluconokinase
MVGGGDVELLTVGRISVDLYASEMNAGFSEVTGFTKSLGGSPTNVAVAAARLGHRSAVLTRVGADPFGAYLREKLTSFGVDISFVGTDPDHRTPLAFAVLDPPEDPPLLFYREPIGTDMTITVDDVDLDLVEEVPILWVTGSALAREPSRGTLKALLARRARRPWTILDLDYRPMFWSSPAEAAELIGGAVGSATVAVGNRSECEVAVGSSDPVVASERLLERGISLAVVKMGSEGVLVATPEQRFTIPPLPIKVLCGLGAGDGFGGALCHGLLEGWPPAEVIRFANAAGAIVASRLLCSDAMPTVQEVYELLEAEHVER